MKKCVQWKSLRYYTVQNGCVVSDVQKNFLGAAEGSGTTTGALRALNTQRRQAKVD